LDAIEINIPCKFALSGEHSVLRGGRAVLLPHFEWSLKIRLESCADMLFIETAESLNEDANLALNLGKAIVPEDKIKIISGKAVLENSIPVGAGLGSSAALSVGIIRLLLGGENQISDDQVIEWARQIENHFHGRSSGMDVATCYLQRPALFSLSDGATPISCDPRYRFTLHDTGERAETTECISIVNALADRDLNLFENLDCEMNGVTDAICESIGTCGPENLIRLASAMNKTTEIYEKWGLLTEKSVKLVQSLRNEGALAARLTGAGGGGFVVALWR